MKIDIPDLAPLDTPAPGSILRLRLPLPFPPGSVNVWLLEDGGGWLAIDAGFGDSRTRRIWRAVLAHPLLGGRPVRRLLLTHSHIDHVGAAGWLAAECGLVPEMSRSEWLLWRATAAEPPEDLLAFQIEHLSRAGCPEARLDAFRARPLAARPARPVPRGYLRRRAGDRIRAAGLDWAVLAGGGHTPEMLMLHAAEAGLFISADQILPRITPFVGVMARDPWGDPLGDFLATLAELPDLPEDTLVLPSHGDPWRGARARIAALRGHHAMELARIRDLCRVPVTAHDAAVAMFARIDDGNFSMAVTEALAHLRHLLLRGELVADLDERGVERFRIP